LITSIPLDRHRTTKTATKGGSTIVLGPATEIYGQFERNENEVNLIVLRDEDIKREDIVVIKE